MGLEPSSLLQYSKLKVLGKLLVKTFPLFHDHHSDLLESVLILSLARIQVDFLPLEVSIVLVEAKLEVALVLTVLWKDSMFASFYAICRRSFDKATQFCLLRDPRRSL